MAMPSRIRPVPFYAHPGCRVGNAAGAAGRANPQIRVSYEVGVHRWTLDKVAAPPVGLPVNLSPEPVR
jgi:hypothetical protein